MEELKLISTERTSLCEGGTGPGAEASEEPRTSLSRDRDLVSDRRRDRGVGDVTLVLGIRKALTYARQGVSALKKIFN